MLSPGLQLPCLLTNSGPLGFQAHPDVHSLGFGIRQAEAISQPYHLTSQVP